MCHHAGTMHNVAWRHFRHAVYPRIHVYASGHEKVSSGNLGSGTLADKTSAHWPRPTENWWSDPRSKLLDWQNPETGPNFQLIRDPRYFSNPRIRSIYRRNPQCVSFLRPNPPIRGPIHPPLCGMAVWPLAHTVTQNYTYQKSEIAHRCKWLKWNLSDGCMALAHTVTQNYSYQRRK